MTISPARSEMAERELFETYCRAAAIEEARPRSALGDDADLGERHARFRHSRFKPAQILRRHSADNFVIVAAGERARKHRGLRCDRAAHGAGERHAPSLDLGTDTRRGTKLGEIPGQ